MKWFKYAETLRFSWYRSSMPLNKESLGRVPPREILLFVKIYAKLITIVSCGVRVFTLITSESMLENRFLAIIPAHRK
jgi:hypothetical protein